LALAISQSVEPRCLKTFYPALNRSPILAKQCGNLLATLPIDNQKQSVQPVMVSRLVGVRNFLIYSGQGRFWIRQCNAFHSGEISFLMPEV
jgi:hypothetical protein